MSKNDEEMAEFRLTVLTREDTRATADALFGAYAKKARQDDTAYMRHLFLQQPAAQTMTHNLMGDTEKIASITPTVDAFFEKVASFDTRTEAQKRYPELMKVASPRAGSFPTPSLAPRKPPSPAMGEVPTKSMLSGGSA